MAELHIEHARKSFASTEVIRDVSVAVDDGGFCTLLGPSGSGKTTLLKLIAGLEQLDAGRVLIGGVDVTGRPPERRNIGIVFQNYALFPHLSVADNVGYGLKSRKLARDDMRARVDEMLQLVGLAGMPGRKPGQLSGGQQQRVALARALVMEPDVLLLDEPLSALDRKIRREMQQEIARIHRETGLTTVMVTHDQEEALDLADQVVVLRDGMVQQAESPQGLYRNPANVFVADFLGAQHFVGTVVTAEAGQAVQVHGIDLAVAVPSGMQPGDDVDVGISLEAVALRARGGRDNGLTPGTVQRLSFLGPTVEAVAAFGTDGASIRSLMLSSDVMDIGEGDIVDVVIDPRGVKVHAR